MNPCCPDTTKEVLRGVTPGPEEAVARSLADLVPRIARNITVELEARPIQLSLRQYRILERLASREHRTTELATHSMVSQPTATTALAPLESRGLVRRRKDPDDARARLVSITPEGRRLLAVAHERIQERLRNIVGEVDEDDAAFLQRLEQKLIAGMDRAREARWTEPRTDPTER